MSIKFRGGYPSQRGRGIGGLLRAAGSLFKPLFKTLSSTALKAARSNTGKMIGNALKEQAINSAINLTADAIRGNDLNESLQNEVGATRQTVGNVVEGIGSMTRKCKAPASNPPKKKKVKRVNVRKFASKNATRGFTSYTDDKAAQNDFFNQS